MKLKLSCSDCFDSLSCKTRIRIVNLLLTKKVMSMMEIAKHFDRTQPTISHHLKYLLKIGLLDFRREGRHVFYSFRPKCNRPNCHLFI